MKQIKVNKRLFQSEPSKLLKAVGAVVGYQAYPSDVYVSKEDYKSMVKATIKMFRKEYPYMKPSSTKLRASIGVHLLNLGPNETLGDAIKPGYVLVDEDSIKEAVKLESQQKDLRTV